MRLVPRALFAAPRPALRHGPAFLAASVLLCFLVSLLASVSLESRTISAGVYDRCAYWIRYSPEIAERRARDPIPPLSLSRVGAAPTGGPFNARPLWPLWLKSSTGSLYFILPLWIPAAIAALPLAVLGAQRVRALYRARFTQSCPNCGYDLRGLAAPTCPECGSPLAAARTR